MATPTKFQIDRATAIDVPTVGAVLARAFQEDPVFQWLTPDDEARRARLPAVFEAFAHVFVPHDETYLTADEAGAAIWAPAAVDPFAQDETRDAFGERMIAALGGDVDKAFLLDEILGEHHPDEPCLFLQFVGVVPEQQGRGIGSRLLETVLARADTTATPAYLDATSSDNRRLYERHGFETIGEVMLPDGPPLWSMWREPRSGVSRPPSG